MLDGPAPNADGRSRLSFSTPRWRRSHTTAPRKKGLSSTAALRARKKSKLVPKQRAARTNPWSDTGFGCKLGDSANRCVAEANARSIEDAITQLADAALKNLPESEFRAFSGGSLRTDKTTCPGVPEPTSTGFGSRCRPFALDAGIPLRRSSW